MGGIALDNAPVSAQTMSWLVIAVVAPASAPIHSSNTRLCCKKLVYVISLAILRFRVIKS